MARIRQSLDLVATLVVSLAVGLLGMLNLTDGPVVSGAILATLGILAAGTLYSRHQMEDLLELARQRLVDTPPADRLLRCSTSGTDADLADAIEIGIIGVTLNRTVRNHAAALRQCVRRGGTVRIAVIDPRGPVPGEAARRSTTPDAAEIFAHRLRPTLDLLEDVAATAGGGRIEVRLLSFVPAFGLLAVNRRRPDGRLHVDIYSHAFSGTEPALTLEAGRDHLWYQHFLGEFDQIWAAGRPA